MEGMVVLVGFLIIGFMGYFVMERIDRFFEKIREENEDSLL